MALSGFGISERLAILISADGRGAIQELEKVGRSAETELGKVEDTTGRIGAQLTRVGAAFLTFGGLAATALFNAAQKSSDLAEAVNVTEITFGGAADEIGRFAQNAAEALGMSERAAREATTTFGGLLLNMGLAETATVEWSQTLTTLAADMASAFNTTPEEAVTALGAALRGESEPIRRYNVMLDDASVRLRAVEMGLAASTSEVDNQDKALARLNIIMEQTSIIHGDFANTSDGLANSQRIMAAQFENLQAQLGQAALPILIEVVSVANSLMSTFMSLDEATGGLASKIAVVATAMTLLAGAVSLGVGAWLKYKAQVDAVAVSSGRAATVMQRMPAVLTGLTLAIPVAMTLWDQYKSNQREAEERVRSLMAAIEESGEIAAGVETHVEGLATQHSDLADAFSRVGVDASEMSRAIAEGGSTWDSYKQSVLDAGREAGLTWFELEALADSLDQVAADTATATDRLGGLADITGVTVTDAVGEAHDVLDLFLTGVRDTAAGLEAADFAFDGVGAAAELAAADTLIYVDALEAERIAQEAATEALREHISVTLEAIDARLAHESATNRTEDAVARLEEVLQSGTASLEDVERASLAAAEAAIRQATTAAEAEVANREFGSESELLAAKQEALVRELQGVADTLSPGNPLRSRLLGYIAELGGVPESVPTTIELLNVDPSGFAVAEYSALLGAIPRAVSTTVTTNYVQNGNPGQLPSGSVGGFFPGGGFMPNAGTVVSGDGHRLAALLPGEMVLNKQQQSAALNLINNGGGGGNTYNLHVGMAASPMELRRMLRDLEADDRRINPGVNA